MPFYLASLISPANVLLFMLPGKVAACRYHALFPWGRVEYCEQHVASTEIRSEDIDILRERLRVRPDDVWAVGLPLRHFTLVNLALPVAAGDDLDQAVRYALMRHVSFDAQRAFVGRMAVIQDKSIAVTALAAPRQEFEEVLTPLRELPVVAVFPALFFFAVAHRQDGVYLASSASRAEMVCMHRGRPAFQLWTEHLDDTDTLFFNQAKTLIENLAPTTDHAYLCTPSQDREKAANFLDLAGESVQEIAVKNLKLPRDLRGIPGVIRHGSNEPLRKNARLFRIQAAATIFLLFCMLSLPAAILFGKIARLKALEQSIAEIRQEGERQMALREQHEHSLVFLRDIASLLEGQPTVSDLLLETTIILPDSVWLSSLRYADRALRIQGVADSAAAVIEAMENSSLFREVRLDSPVTKSGDKDTFHISARVEP